MNDRSSRRARRGAVAAALTAAVTVGSFGVSVPVAGAHEIDCLPEATSPGSYLSCLVSREEHCILDHLTLC